MLMLIMLEREWHNHLVLYQVTADQDPESMIKSKVDLEDGVDQHYERSTVTSVHSFYGQ